MAIPTSPKATFGGVITCGVLLACLLIGGCCGGCVLIPEINYSDGERTGTITKFSHKGLFWKTWEGEMNCGGFKNKSDGDKSQIIANIWEFSATDQEVINQIQDAQRNGGTYTLHYRQVINMKPWNGGTGYYVVKVVPQGK